MRRTSVKNGVEQVVGQVAERLDVHPGHHEGVARGTAGEWSRNATVCSVSATTGAASSPATIAQKTQGRGVLAATAIAYSGEV